MNKETIALIMKVIQIIEVLYKGYKQHEREKLVNEIKSKPSEAWNERFGTKPSNPTGSIQQ